jgi:hypothetical protein
VRQPKPDAANTKSDTYCPREPDGHSTAAITYADAVTYSDAPVSDSHAKPHSHANRVSHNCTPANADANSDPSGADSQPLDEDASSDPR